MKSEYFLLVIVAVLVSQGCLESLTQSSEVSAGFTGYPRRSEVGKPLTISWWLSYPRNLELTHSAIHYGHFSHPGQLGFDVSPNDLEYRGVVEVFPEQLRNNNNNFKVTIIPHQNGTLYFRAHAIFDGNNYWSEEQSIQIG